MRVLVTGATGFIASHTIADLLASGHDVRGTVRSIANARAEGTFESMPGRERLEFVEADLLDAGAFDAAVAGCDAVLHMASPYVVDVADPQRDLVDPAVMGTRSVLEAAARAPGVRRVVLTSSAAAISDEPPTDRLLTEADWNEKSSLARNPYYYSKTLAERAAWRFVEEARPGFDLVVVNPVVVVGPSLSKRVNESVRILLDLATGRYPVIMDLGWSFVDVRDVARAHVLAMTTAAASGRYVCAAKTLMMRDLVPMLKGALPRAKLPSLAFDGAFGSALMRLASYTQPPGAGSYLRSNLGRPQRLDNAKIRRELGLAFRDVERSVVDTVEDLVRWGHVVR